MSCIVPFCWSTLERHPERLAASPALDDTLSAAEAPSLTGNVHESAGLFSTLDALLGVSLEQALDTVPLAEPVVRALVHVEGDLGRRLRCVQDYESGRWDALGPSGLSNQQLRDAYVAALAWADATTGLVAAE
jgi:hypothetical protein